MPLQRLLLHLWQILQNSFQDTVFQIVI